MISLNVKLSWMVTLTVFTLTVTIVNVLPYSLNAKAERDVVVTIEPASLVIPDVGVTFKINVTVQNVENLYGWELKLYYPRDLINGTSAAEGSFLKQDGIFTFFGVHEFKDEFNETHGRIWAYCTRTGNVSGVSGSGTLLSITFKSKAVNGPKNITLDDVKLSDSQANKIQCTVLNGQIEVVPEISVNYTLLIVVFVIMILYTLGTKNMKRRSENTPYPTGREGESI